MRGDDHGFESVDALEFEGLGIRRPGHARELLVHAEIVLEGDRGKRLVFLLDRHAFLGLDGLMQTFRPAAAAHQTAGEFVDDDDFAILHDVVLVLEEQRVRAQRRIDMMHQHDVAGIVQAAAFGQQAQFVQHGLDFFVPRLGQQHLARLFVDPVIPFAVFLLLPHELRRHSVDAHVKIGVVVGLTRNDERRAGLVDENGVDFVDDGEMQRALYLVGHLIDHVVAQVVETVFVVGAVGDIGGVGLLFLFVRHLREVDAGGETEKTVQPAHGLGVALGEIVVHRHHVHALAGQGVQVGGQRGHQRLALAGTHFGDLAFVQHHAADQLHVEMAHAEHALRTLAHHGESLGQQLVQRLALVQPRPEFGRLRGQFGVGELFHRWLQRVDRLDLLQVLFNQPVVAAAKDLLEHGLQHGESKCPRGAVKR